MFLSYFFKTSSIKINNSFSVTKQKSRNIIVIIQVSIQYVKNKNFGTKEI